jgi:hybrid cluster-associated redox disulfide protein
LIEKYGMFCVGCGAAAMETLEEGAQVHGMSEKKIDKMIEYLNKIISDKKQP